MLDTTTLRFEDFTATAPHDSAQWASTDRGWLYADGSGCVGFYLHYPARQGWREDGFVLASVYERYSNELTGTWFMRNERSTRCATVQQARAWMLEQHTGQMPLL